VTGIPDAKEACQKTKRQENLPKGEEKKEVEKGDWTAGGAKMAKWTWGERMIVTI